ncbi:MAG: S53 family peptidase [Gammaproteobacteria bacterium]|nr:S53 family peptidase [Gammaproteobacteria bacterium]
MKKIIYSLLLICLSNAYAKSAPINCETPASIACVYGLTSSVPGCPTNATTANPQGGWGAIAVVEALDNAHAQSDLNTFSTQFGLPATSITVVYTPPAPSTFPLTTGCANLLPASLTPPKNCETDVTAGNDPCDEHVADIEWAHAMAPAAKIIMVEAPSDNLWDKMYAVCYATQYVKNQAGGGGVSMSWSVSEFATETGFDRYFQTTPNIVYVASSGDKSAPANYPSSSPYVISAGGTSLIRNAQGNFTGETAWSSNPNVAAGSKNGGSGGPSLYEPRPSYQNSVAKIVGNARGTPDIAFNSDPSTGVCVYSSLHQPAGWFTDGGTSIAAPALSGIINSANHRASSSFDELTYIYGNAIKNYHSYWHDIVQGYNGYPALVGYDFTTGLGSPQGYVGK